MFYTYQQFETLKIQNQFEVRCLLCNSGDEIDWNPPDLGVIKLKQLSNV